MALPHTSIGVLRASVVNGLHRLALDVDPGIVEVARALVPKYSRLNRTRYAPHVSLVREEKRVLPNWGKHDGEEVPFTYESYVYADELYWWLRVQSPRLLAVRVELGLAPMDWYTRPPDNSDFFHCTIGNCKPQP